MDGQMGLNLQQAHMLTVRAKSILPCCCCSYVQAIQFYNEALRHHEPHAKSMLALAKLHLAHGNMDECQQQVMSCLNSSVGHEGCCEHIQHSLCFFSCSLLPCMGRVLCSKLYLCQIRSCRCYVFSTPLAQCTLYDCTHVSAVRHPTEA